MTEILMEHRYDFFFYDTLYYCICLWYAKEQIWLLMQDILENTTHMYTWFDVELCAFASSSGICFIDLCSLNLAGAASLCMSYSINSKHITWTLFCFLIIDIFHYKWVGAKCQTSWNTKGGGGCLWSRTPTLMTKWERCTNTVSPVYDCAHTQTITQTVQLRVRKLYA